MATYTIIGGDGREYGSVPEEQLREWIHDGRANARTRVKVEGSADWKTLGEIQEFQSALAAAMPSAPPPLPASEPVKTSGMAIASLVLGVLGLFTCGVSALVGLILGIIAMVKVKNSNGKLGGGGLALAGTIVSGIFLLMIPIFAAMLLPALAAAQQKAQEINCVNNEKQLALAMMMYSNDHTNCFPTASTWCDAIKPSVGSDMVFRCVFAVSSNRCDYAFNSKLDGLPVSAVSKPATTVLIFESDAGWNAHGGPEMIPSQARHLKNSYVVAFVDGHVEAVNQSRLSTLRWNP